MSASTVPATLAPLPPEELKSRLTILRERRAQIDQPLTMMRNQLCGLEIDNKFLQRQQIIGDNGLMEQLGNIQRNIGETKKSIGYFEKLVVFLDEQIAEEEVPKAEESKETAQ